MSNILIFGHFFNDCLKECVEYIPEMSTATSKIPPYMVTNKDNVVLILRGSFNPIHNGHIEMSIRAKEYLKQYNRYIQVVTCIIVPLDDEALCWKFNGQPHEVIPYTLRTKLCEIVSDKIWIYTWGNSMESWYKMEKILKFRALNLGFKLIFVEVYGSDLYRASDRVFNN